MKLRLAASLSLISLFLFLSSTEGLTEAFWIDGQIVTQPVDQIYDMQHYLTFNFTAADTNSSLVSPPETVYVACPTSVASQLTEGGFYNFTGALVDVQTGDIPQGTFVVSQVNTPPMSDWTTLIIEVINILSAVMRQIALTVAELIFVFTGYVVPEWLITLVLVGCLAWFIIKNFKTLSIVLVIIVAFIIVSGGANLIRLLIT